MSRAWPIALALLSFVAAAAGMVYWQRGLPSLASSALTPASLPQTTAPATTPVASPAAVRQDPVQSALADNALLTPEAARALADAWQRRGLDTGDLGETALVVAVKGFGTLPAAQADALRSSFDRLYAVLAPDDRAATERLLGEIREG